MCLPIYLPIQVSTALQHQDTGRLSFDLLIFQGYVERLLIAQNLGTHFGFYTDYFCDMAHSVVCFMFGKWFLRLSSRGMSCNLAPRFALCWSNSPPSVHGFGTQGTGGMAAQLGRPAPILKGNRPVVWMASGSRGQH